MFKQEIMKPESWHTWASWLSRFRIPRLHFSGFHGFLLNFDFGSQSFALQGF